MTNRLYQHFLITRFNLKFKGNFLNDRNGLSTQTEKWLSERFALFDTYCFPSVAKQSCNNFTWLVLFDKDTPQHFKVRIQHYQHQFTRFTPLYLTAHEASDLVTYLQGEITKRLMHAPKSRLITTRLDNDDALHKNMIEQVQTDFKKWGNNNTFLNYEHGLQYDIIQKVAVHYFYKNNHFLSRIEPGHNFQTVLAADHTQIEKIATVQNIYNKKPLWMEIVHQSNISNAIRLNKPLINPHKLKYFGITNTFNYKTVLRYYRKWIKKLSYESMACLAKKTGLFKHFKKFTGKLK